jgi:hypothetical protein
MGFRSHRVYLAVLLAASVPGCGGRATSPVRGVVTLDGTPVPEATVLFMPDGPEGGRPATGFTAADGTFLLTTYRQDDGALPGSYRILIQKSEAAKDAGTAARSAMERAKAKIEEKSAQRTQKPTLPKAYSHFDTTPLRCSVPVSGVVSLDMHKGGKD